jgi:hypothetical protein
VSAPPCGACRGVGTDPEDGSECPACEGAGLAYLNARSAADRAEVARRIVVDFGALAACEAAGLKLDVRDPQADYEGARRDFESSFDEDFGSGGDTRISVGLAGVSTLREAMREAVKAAAVATLFQVVADARAAGDESALDELDAEAIRGAA